MSFPAQVQATARCCGKVHDKIIQRRDRSDGVCIDRHALSGTLWLRREGSLGSRGSGQITRQSSRCALRRGGCFLFCDVAAACRGRRIAALDRGRPAGLFPAEYCGRGYRLETARGHVVLVHFFATWCEPCREELPALNRLAARADGSVKVLAIAVADADRSVQRFFETTPVDFPVLLDRDRAVAKAWNVTTLPTTFVLDASLQPKLVVETDYAWDSLDPGSSPVRPRRTRAALRQSKMPAIDSLGGRPCTDANFCKPARR